MLLHSLSARLIESVYICGGKTNQVVEKVISGIHRPGQPAKVRINS